MSVLFGKKIFTTNRQLVVLNNVHTNLIEHIRQLLYKVTEKKFVDLERVVSEMLNSNKILCLHTVRIRNRENW